MERITLRYPNGEKKIESNDVHLLNKLIDWMREYPHFSEFDEEQKIFVFEDKKFVSQCNLKWLRLCANECN